MISNRFKFRVFIKQSRLLKDLDSFFIDPLRDKITLHFSDNHTKTMKSSDFVLEQCTGLKDKNGKLIYEGDILKTLDGSICLVVWDGISFWSKSLGSEARDWEYNSFYEHCEVIGNIHQNPELLKDK